jgi:hypothetical protein
MDLENINRDRQISFCTAVMNRLDHLKLTLPANLNDNMNSNVEFLILDYNSSDGLKEWLLSNYSQYLDIGIISYYRTNEPTVFSHSHSKNIAMKLAKGSVVCNVDADNFIGPGFYKYLEFTFENNSNIFVAATDRKFNSNNKSDWLTGDSDFLGRIALKKSDFLSLQGYDESFLGYGFEDSDLINRLEIIGLERCVIRNSKFLRAINHDDSLRFSVKEMRPKIYLYQHTFFESTCVFLYPNEIAYLGTIIDNKTFNAKTIHNGYLRRTQQFDFSLRERGWIQGSWKKKGDNIKLLLEDGCTLSFKKLKDKLVKLDNLQDGPNIFFQMQNEDLIDDLTKFKESIKNRYHMISNLENNVTKANGLVWGATTLYDLNNKIV